MMASTEAVQPEASLPGQPCPDLGTGKGAAVVQNRMQVRREDLTILLPREKVSS